MHIWERKYNIDVEIMFKAFLEIQMHLRDIFEDVK